MQDLSHYRPITTPAQSDTQALSQLLGGSDAWRMTPATFANKVTRGAWKPAKHLLYTSTTIARGLLRGNARIVVSMPPRHGKSELISAYTPQWILDKWSHYRIILASYGADLALNYGRRVRDEMVHNHIEGLTQTQLASDSKAVDRFHTTMGGGMMSVGTGGPITGFGADVLIIDDYVKNAKEAASQTLREDAWDWFTSTAMSRLEPNGSVIIIATRWNIDDIIGRIRKKSSEDWEIINFPAIATREDEIGRKPGDALWPERYGLEALNALKTVQGTYFWSALYQQEPIPPGAGMVSAGQLVPIDLIPHRSRLRLCRAWDFAGTASDGDYTVGALIAEDMDSGLTYILDIFRGQISPTDIETVLVSTAIRDGADVQISLEQEPGSAGKIVVEHYQKLLKGFLVVPVKPTGPKFVRAQPFFAKVQAGMVRMKRAPWNQALEDELVLFPDGMNDDQVDALSAAYNRLNGKALRGITWGRPTITNRPKVVNFDMERRAAEIAKRINMNSDTHAETFEAIKAEIRKKSYSGGVTFGRRRP